MTSPCRIKCRTHCRIKCRPLAFFAFGFLCLLFLPAELVANPDFPKPLIEQYHDLKDELANSVFGSPIVLRSETSEHHAEGQVFAVLNTPFSQVNDILSQPKHWCEVVILHINVKACTYKQLDGKQKVTFYVGRQYYQSPSQAFPLEYRFETKEKTSTHLYVQLSSADGPFGTHDYLINLEAVPIDEQHSFIRFQYRYHFGLLARMAMSTYLATFGRHKVGFTLKGGVNISGEPAYVKGVQGVVERNTIRYIYAIQATLEASHYPEDKRQRQAFENWYTLISRHPRQLVDYTREEYFERKTREIKNQLALQREIQREEQLSLQQEGQNH